MGPIRIEVLSPVDASRDRDASRGLDLCLALRREVFVSGQGVPLEREIDGLDHEAEHFLALEEKGGGRTTGRPVGTARLRIVDGRAKIERVAVEAPSRGRRIGRRLMEAVEARALAVGAREAILNAQLDVVPFYLGLGYHAEGDVFEDAGIPHRAMRKSLADASRLPQSPSTSR